MLAPVFASMIEPSVVSPGGPALLAAARWVALSGRPPGGRCLRIASQCAPQDGGANAADQTTIMWRLFARLARSFLVPRRPGLATGGRRDSLVLQTTQALALAQHREYVEDRRRGRPAGKRSAQRLRDATELNSLALGKSAHGVLGRLGAPGLDCLEVSGKVSEERARIGGQQARRVVIERQRTRGAEEACPVRALAQGLGPLLQAAHGREQLLTRVRRQFRGKL